MPQTLLAESLDVNHNWEPMEKPSTLRKELIAASLGIAGVCFLWALAVRATTIAKRNAQRVRIMRGL